MPSIFLWKDIFEWVAPVRWETRSERRALSAANMTYVNVIDYIIRIDNYMKYLSSIPRRTVATLTGNGFVNIWCRVFEANDDGIGRSWSSVARPRRTARTARAAPAPLGLTGMWHRQPLLITNSSSESHKQYGDIEARRASYHLTTRRDATPTFE